MIKRDSKKTKLMEDLFKKLLLEDDNCDKRVETNSEKERLEDFEGYDCTWDTVNEEYCCKKIKKDKEEKKKKEEEKKKKEEKKDKVDLLKKYPSTGLSKDDGNKFREWMNSNHSDFKDENGEKLDKKGEPDNGTIRQAWDKYKTDYQKPDTQDTGSGTVVDTGSDKKVDDEKKEEPPKRDIPKDSFYNIDCQAWDEDINYFYEDFPGKEIEKAEEFYDWLRTNYGSYYLKQFKVESGCEFKNSDPKSPFLETFADATYVKEPKITNYEAWKQGKKIKESKKMKKRLVEGEKRDPNFVPKYKDYNITNINSFFIDTGFSLGQTMIPQAAYNTAYNTLKSLYDMASSLDVTESNRKNTNICFDFMNQYIVASKLEIDKYFGNPNYSDLMIYEKTSKFWYGFLIVLQIIKTRIIDCIYSIQLQEISNKKKNTEFYTKLTQLGYQYGGDYLWSIYTGLSQSTPQTIDIKTIEQNLKYSSDARKINYLGDKLDEAEDYVVEAKQESIIRKKLLEVKMDKKINKLIKDKLTSKKKRVDKLVESMEILYLDLYRGDSERFFKRMFSLYETHKKSNLLINEDTESISSDFDTAFKRVYSGVENDVKENAIPYFIERLGVHGEIKNCLENELNKIPPAEIQKMFTDTDEIAEKVLNCVILNTNPPQSQPLNVMSAIENVMIDSIGTSQVKNKLKNHFIEIIKPIQDESSLKIKDKSDELVKALIQTLSKI